MGAARSTADSRTTVVLKNKIPASHKKNSTFMVNKPLRSSRQTSRLCGVKNERSEC